MKVTEAILEIAKQINPTYAEAQASPGSQWGISGTGVVTYRFGNPHNEGAIELTIPSHLADDAELRRTLDALVEMMQQ